MTHTFLHFFLNIIIFGCNLGLIVYVLIIITFNFSHFDILATQINNWYLNPLSEIIASPTNLIPVNYNSLLNYTFPGIEAGCDCLSIPRTSNDLSDYTWEGQLNRGICSPSQLLAGCFSVNPVQKITVNEIEKEFGIFYKRNKDNNYYKWYHKNVFKNCESVHLVSCGIIDTVGNHLCLEKKENCPSIRNDYNYNLQNFTKIENLLLLIISNPLLFIDFKSFTTKEICVNPAESQTSGNNMTYILFPSSNYFDENGKEKGCTTSVYENITTDSRYSSIFSVNIESILSKENINIFKKLPIFPYKNFVNSEINLFFRGYVGWDKKCEKYFTQLEDFPVIQYHIRAYFTIFLVNGLIVLPYYLLFIMIVTQIDFSNFRLHFLLSISYTILLFLFFLMVRYEYLGIIRTENIIDSIATKICGDHITNRLFLNLLEDIRVLEKDIFITLYWIIMMLFASILKIVLVITKTNKRLLMLTLMSSNNPSINTDLITPVELELINI